MESLRKLNDEGATIVMVTHSPEHAGHAKRTVSLLDGQVVSDGRR
jgi:putative ABC transport system ATP-binding protein